MQIKLIRNATFKLYYHDKVFLTDPMFSQKHGFRSFVGKAKNPLVELPCAVKKILADIDAVVISHLHFDHEVNIF